MRQLQAALISILLALILASGCRKDSFVDDANAMLGFSADTLTFDTVFVTLGSVTGRFKVYNNFKNPLLISEISLAGNSNGQFRINVNGVSGTNFTDVTIPGDDSLYVFVQVTVDPNNNTLPFVMGEDVEFIVNGNKQSVHLMAWGQNANFYRGEKICDEVWDNTLPYVIKSRVDPQTGEFFAGVEVEKGCTLTIREGTRVYFDGNASGMIIRGTIEILGTQSDTVIFQGARLERFYEDLPGQWLGIFIFRESRGNRMEHFIMDESNFGINVGSIDTTSLLAFTNATRSELSMKNCIIKNNLRDAIFAFNSDMTVENCLMWGGTENLVTLGLGGEYFFDNTTLYNSGSITTSHDNKVLLISNFAADNTVKVINDVDSAVFTNCIIYGSLEDELALSRDPAAEYNVHFDHCLLKTILQIDTVDFVDFTANLLNNDPEFLDQQDENFRLKDISPCVDAGINNGVLDDLDGKVRPNGSAPDIGAYEF